MAVEVIITDRKVFNQYANGIDLDQNTGNYTSYLRGGVMNVQKVRYLIEIGWAESFSSNDGQNWSVSGNKLQRLNGSWVGEGFSIGDTIDLTLGGISQFTDRVITNISDIFIFFDGAAVPSAQSGVSGLLQAGKTDLFGLEYSFGIIENTQQVDEYISLLDNSDQTYYADNIGIDSGGGRDTTFIPMLSKSEDIQSWDTSRVGNTKVRFVDRPSTYIQRFEIEHEYIINPYLNDSLYEGNKSLKYISKFDFRINLANINTSKTQTDQLQLGSVGYFNENYDGYQNDFTISNLVYEDVATASTQTELNIKSKTKVSFSVNSASGLFTTLDPFVVFHSFIPSVNQYSKQPEKYRPVWAYESLSNDIDAIATDNGIIKNASSSLVDANNIDVEFEIEFTIDQQQYIEEDNTYKLAIEVGDGDLVNQSKNVTLLIDENTYSKDNNIPDLIINDDFGFNPYYRFIAPTNDLFTSYYGWIEDEIVSYARFGVNRTPSKDATINTAFFKLVAYEDATGETFELQNEELDLSGVLIAPTGTINANPWNIQLIEDSRTRGYRLPNGDEFNLLLFETKDNDGTYQYYEWRVGFKMNWQSWIALPNADNIFINTSDSFNGKNNRASNYSLKNGWSIRVQWAFDMSGLDDFGNAGQTDYNFYTDQFSIFDFDEQDDNPTTWTCKLETFDEEDVLLSTVNDFDLDNAIIQTDKTRLVGTFTPQAPYIIGDIVQYWGEFRIAEKDQQGFNNDVLSTTKPYLDDNKLIPLDGDNFAKISLVSNTIVIECLVDNTKLKENVSYKPTIRLANQDEPLELITWTVNYQHGL
jgi:hypothetical protein